MKWLLLLTPVLVPAVLALAIVVMILLTFAAVMAIGVMVIDSIYRAFSSCADKAVRRLNF